MARFPGTESHSNRSGLTPGEAVRCRRSRANADRGLADCRGFLAEVRPGRVSVLLNMLGRMVWLESEDVLPEPLPETEALEALRSVYRLLGGHRIEFDEEEGITIFTSGFSAEKLEMVRKLMGNRLLGLEVAAHGVHEMGVLLRQTD
ncbi:MAG: hypothetical protein P8N09_10185 [Planctomycetota bacterium]|nr:hypothetical protein [Planctomycetota bacterium]